MNIEQILENLTEEEAAQILSADFGADLEKEASAELAKADLAEALYAYGAFMADVEVESQEELSKEASAEIEQTSNEIATILEEALVESGVLESEDTVELHKEAQAAAAIIFEGYSDQIEKIAAEEAKMEKLKKAIKGGYDKALAKGKEHAAKASEFAAKHKKPLIGGAAGLAALGAGAYLYKKKHEKKASEVTASEMAEIIREDQMIDATIAEGFDKLAGAAKKKGMAQKVLKEKLKAKHGGMMNAVKRFAGKNSKALKIGGGAAALGGAALLANKMMKKEK